MDISAPKAICQFSYSEDGINFYQLGKPFKAQPGKWIGAKVGVFCVSTQKAVMMLEMLILIGLE